jgi:hypothetical protein
LISNDSVSVSIFIRSTIQSRGWYVANRFWLILYPREDCLHNSRSCDGVGYNHPFQLCVECERERHG